MSDQVDQTNPKHVGIILDGNRRWAKEKGLPTLDGHQKGAENLKDLVREFSTRKSIEYLSVFVFSTENWQRTKDEVSYLMRLAYNLIAKDLEEIHKEGIRILWLGSRDKVDKKLANALDASEEKTKDNKNGTMCLCFNYGGQQEVVDATKKLIEQGASADSLDIEKFEQALYHPEVPPVDLLIRTSGEKRTSGFMLWRAAYAELYFTDKYWPDFKIADLDDALAEYSLRQRRYGK